MGKQFVLFFFSFLPKLSPLSSLFVWIAVFGDHPSTTLHSWNFSAKWKSEKNGTIQIIWLFLPFFSFFFSGETGKRAFFFFLGWLLFISFFFCPCGIKSPPPYFFFPEIDKKKGKLKALTEEKTVWVREREKTKSQREQGEKSTPKIFFLWSLLSFFFSPFFSSYLVDPASSHMLVSKIKPCMPKYKLILYGETANGSLNQL